MNKLDRWFKKKNPISIYFYWFMGKFIILLEVFLYLLSMKCVLVDIIPKRLSSFLDFPITCLILFGYLLTFRSLFLACYTDSATQISEKNYLLKEQHEEEKKKKEQIEAEKKKKAEKEKAELKQKQLEKKAKKTKSCCGKKQLNEKSQVDAAQKGNNEQSSQQTNNSQSKNEKGKQNNKQQKQYQIEKTDKHEHSQECKNQHCHENQHDHNKDKQKSKICLKCNIVKEKHDHHCSMCNKCVYRLDHHCFFIGQCVGDYNYLYFISYVFLSYAMTMIVLLFIIPDVIDFFQLQWDNLSSSFIEIFILLLGGLLFHFFTMILLVSHLYYISNELTFLENLHNMKKKEYSALEWICIIMKCQARAKLYDTFTARWHQIFGNLNFTSIVYPEGTKIKID